MCLGEELVTVDERDLEVREVGVQPLPVEIPRLVFVHVRGKRRLDQLLEPPLPEVGAVGVANDVHRVRSATTNAARPSPRPANPSRSVVVARTEISRGSTPSAPARRSAISPRISPMRGSSPTSTQSALRSSHPASRTSR